MNVRRLLPVICLVALCALAATVMIGPTANADLQTAAAADSAADVSNDDLSDHGADGRQCGGWSPGRFQRGAEWRYVRQSSDQSQPKFLYSVMLRNSKKIQEPHLRMRLFLCCGGRGGVQRDLAVRGSVFRGQGSECKVLSAKCKVQSAKCKVLSAKCKVQSAKCKMQNANCKVLSAKCKVQSAKC